VTDQNKASQTRTVKPRKPQSRPPNGSSPNPRSKTQSGKKQSDPLDLAPHSTDAEEAVLGSLLMNPEAVNEVSTFLDAEDFFNLRHGWIYEAIQRLHERSDGIDTRTLAEELRAQKRLDDVGGEAYLNWLPTTMPTALHAEVYGHIVERAAIRRRLLGAAGEIARLAHDETRDIGQVTEQSEAAVFAVTERKTSRSLVPMRVAVSEYFDRLEQARLSETKGYGIPTGLADLDKLLGGLQKGDLVITAGRPGTGKTSLLLTIALNAVRIGQARVALFSMEMGREQIVQRATAIETGISSQRLRVGEVSDQEWAQFVQATDSLSRLSLYIDDSAAQSPQQVLAKCRRMYREHGLDLILIDYLQLMNAGGRVNRDANRVQEITYISRALKELARELNVPVLAAAQLSRAVEQRKDKRPQLPDLRESGSIENDADIVLFVYRDELYNEATEHPGEADLIVAKHRNGPTGTVTVLFRKELTKFVDLRRTLVNLADLGKGGGTEGWRTYVQITEGGTATR